MESYARLTSFKNAYIQRYEGAFAVLNLNLFPLRNWCSTGMRTRQKTSHILRLPIRFTVTYIKAYYADKPWTYYAELEMCKCVATIDHRPTATAHTHTHTYTHKKLSLSLSLSLEIRELWRKCNSCLSQNGAEINPKLKRTRNIS